MTIEKAQETRQLLAKLDQVKALFKPGDVVVLKSGGPRMVVAPDVEGVAKEGEVFVLYHNSRGDIERDTLPEIVLKLVQAHSHGQLELDSINGVQSPVIPQPQQ